MGIPQDVTSEVAGHDGQVVTPDVVAVPPRAGQVTPLVGIGGSAGSIHALAAFFKAMPPDSGMAFVVILHLSPSHESTLPELLGRVTTMPVEHARDGLAVAPDHVYVIPPGKYLATVDGHLRLSELEPERGKRVAVDLFFRSLADACGPDAVAIVLSGADADGALGIKRVKELGGLTIAQDPEEAEYSGMPRSSIETGMIDWVLEVEQIPLRLLEYRANARRLKLPPEDGPPSVTPPPTTAEEGEAALRDVLTYLRSRTGRDFSYYKRATILRRIARRMQVNGIDELPAYLAYLRTHPGEAGALLQDLLISVTNFFRDRDAFGALEGHIPELFRSRTQSDSIRVWVPACATGEEAYSIAILLLEYAGTLDGTGPALQVFACDLDDDAIQKARAGHYPDTIEADVSEERLRRCFVKDQRGYRVRRELREMVLFASHDLLKDAPFSRMDLISCRNLLIYLNRDAQRRVFDLFHFALRPGGRLFLGMSETVDDGSLQFGVLDKKHRIYVHQPAPRFSIPLLNGPDALLRTIEAQQEAASPVVHGKRFSLEATTPFQGRLGTHLDRGALAELHLQLVERLAPPSVIVDAQHEIVHLSEHAGEFLVFAGGEPTTNLMRVVHPALRTELRTALYQAGELKTPVHARGVPAAIDGRQVHVDIHVVPVWDVAPGHLLVTFNKRENVDLATTDDREPPLASETVLRHLERELEQVKTLLRDTVERYEGSTEELRASNEELKSMNEELRSATEELETSRQELQSINEELTTVNQEMKSKVEELALSNSDLQNLMAATAIATVFLDRDLRITRYTPSAAEIFPMIPGDIGRPLAHLKHRLDYPDLMTSAAQVLRSLVPIECEVSGDDRIYIAKQQPYRTLDDHIAGVVLTLVDVTDRHRVGEALRHSEERMRILIESARDYAIFTVDRDRIVDSWSAGAETMFGYTESEILGKSADVLFTPSDLARGDPAHEIQTALKEGRAESERWHSRKDASAFYGSGSVMPLGAGSGAQRGFLKIIRNLTETKRAQEALAERMDDLERFNDVAVGRETRMIELKAEVNALRARLGEAPRYAEQGDDNTR